MSKIRLVATGDSLITRRLPCTRDRGFEQLAQLIKTADARFTNLETVIRRKEGFPAAQSGGTWTSAAPEVLADLKAYGFNMLNWATNHTLDYSYGGLMSTRQYMQEYGFVQAGAGENLSEASQPNYLETPGGRVALIAATASFHESWIAGEQRHDVVGRPGINPLRHSQIYRLKAEKIKVLRAAAAACGINARHDMSVKNGFLTPDPDGMFRFGSNLFRATGEGEEEGESTAADQRDMKRIFRSISEAARQATLVLVSIHGHAFRDGSNDLAADFLVEFSRACIDHGAHAVIGHGPHIVRGVEVYKNRPIFYSLGNFIFQSDTVEKLPADYYEKYGLGPEHTTADAFDVRSDCDRRGLAANPDIWRSVVPVWEMQDGDLTMLELYPVCLGFGKPRAIRGWPVLSEDLTVLETIRDLSIPCNTSFNIEDGKAVWKSGT